MWLPSFFLFFLYFSLFLWLEIIIYINRSLIQKPQETLMVPFPWNFLQISKVHMKLKSLWMVVWHLTVLLNPKSITFLSVKNTKMLSKTRFFFFFHILLESRIASTVFHFLISIFQSSVIFDYFLLKFLA